MGTNYYWQREVCPHCGRGDEEIHIGKSSAGWCFALHVYPHGDNDEGTYINSLDDWKALWETEGSNIRNEYGDVVPVSEMLLTITKRSKAKPLTPDMFKRGGIYYKSYRSLEEFYNANYGEPGPYNLIRHRIERDAVDGYYGTGCIGHGEGTWDLLVGDFS